MEKTIGLAISLVGAVGTLMFIFKLLPGFMLAFQGDCVNATNVVVNVGVEEIISGVYWGIILAIVSPIVGFFIYIFRK
jgi:hypothetical protein